MKITGKHRKAVVLIGVMWAMIVLSVIVTIIARTSMLDSRISMSCTDRIRCKWAARAGMETAIAVLDEDETDSDSLYDIWSDNVEDLSDIELDMCSFSVEITDESSKLNINTITGKQLMYLPDMTEQIADAILDWRDRNDEPRTAGVESAYYSALPYPYLTRNGAFATIRELLLVKGVTEAMLYGKGDGAEYLSDYNQGWINYLSCYSYDHNVDADGNRRVNINSASEKRLQNNLDIKASQAKWIVENRSYKTIVDLMSKTASSSSNGNNNSGNNNSSNNSSGNNNSSNNSSSNNSSGNNNSSSSSNNSTGNNNRGDSGNNSRGNNNSSSSSNNSSRGNNNSGSGNNSSQSEQLDRDTFYEIVDKITTTNRGKIRGSVNINTAGVDVLTALLEGKMEVAQDIITYRQGLDDGISSLAELQNVESITEDIAKKLVAYVTTRSSVYSVYITAEAETTGGRYSVEAVVDRSKSPAEILYWREGAGI